MVFDDIEVVIASLVRNDECEDCFGERELRREEQDHGIQSDTMELEVQERLAEMENRFEQRYYEVSARAAEVEKECRNLTLRNKSLTQENEALIVELEATRVRQQLDQNSFRAATSSLETKSASLEEEIRENEKNMNILKTEFNSLKTTCSFYKNETDNLSKKVETLVKEQDLTIQNCCILRDELRNKMRYVQKECERRIANMANASKQKENENGQKIKELAENLENRELLISQLLETVGLRDAEFEQAASHIQTLVKGTLEEVLESTKKIDEERDDAISFKRNVEDDVAQVAQVLNKLNEVILQQQRETDTLCRAALNELGHVEIDDDKFLKADCIDDDEDAGNAHRGRTIPLAEIIGIAVNMLKRIKTGEATLMQSFQAIGNWKRRNDEQVQQLTERIEELVQLTSSANLKHMSEMDNLSQKLKRYKTLIVRLRKKFSKEPDGQNLDTTTDLKDVVPDSNAISTMENLLRNPEDQSCPARYLNLVDSLLQFNCKVDEADRLANVLS